MKKYIFFFFLVFGSALFAANFDTLQPDILHVEIQPEGELVRNYLRAFAKTHDIEIVFTSTPTDGSWTHPGEDRTDIVAHGLYPLDERPVEDATYTLPFLRVLRSLEIRREDIGKYETIDDFIGKAVAAPEGTTAEKDLRNRAPEGVKIVTVKNFSEGYDLLYRKEVEAFAVGYYLFPEGYEYHQTYYSIDIHPFDPENPDSESLHFLVRDKSIGLGEAINDFIEDNPFPLQK